jgi:hypothetical protein
MKYVSLLLLLTQSLFAQKELHFDTFLHYEYQQDTLKKNVIFLTSKKNPEFTLAIYPAKNGISSMSLFKFDSAVCHNEVILNDFLKAESLSMVNKKMFSLDVENFKQENSHYVFKEISQNPILYEFATTRPKRKVKKHAVQIVQVEMIPGSENEIMFSNGTVLKSLISKLEAKYHGIPSKITYLRAEDRTLMYAITLIEKVDISKKILL